MSNENQLTVPDDQRGLARGISLMLPQIRETLPPGIDPDRFKRAAMNAIQNMPELADPQVDRQTVFNACLRAAQLGLMPDKREGAIVIVNEKRKIDGRDVWIKTAQFRDMVGGLRKLAAEFGFDLIAHSVYENDEFDHEFGDNERIFHKAPKFGTPRGNLIGAYAIATRFSDGRKYRKVMDMEAINKRRAVAQTQAVWDKWTAEQSEKTVARALFKVLPLHGDEAQTERFDRLVTREDEVEQTAADATSTPEPAQKPASEPRRRARSLDAVAATAPRQDADDAIDGEFSTVDPAADAANAAGNAAGNAADAESHF